MRFAVAALALCLAAGQAMAQTPATPAPSAPAAVTPAPPVSKPAPRRMTMRQRFAAANTTHDGHLTKAQAQQAHMVAAVRHFDAIDKGHKGYITFDEMRAYAAAQRAQHKAAKQPPA